MAFFEFVLAGTANLDCLCRHSSEKCRTYQLTTEGPFSPATLREHGNLSLSTRRESLVGREDYELLGESCSETN